MRSLRGSVGALLVAIALASCANPPSPSVPVLPPTATPAPTPGAPSSLPRPGPSSSSTAAPSPSDPPAEVSGGLLWRRVDGPAGRVFTAVIADGSGFLAVARDDESQATDYAPEFWRSTDGLSWSQIRLFSTAPFIPDQPDRYYYTVTSLVRNGATIVAVGDRLLDDASTGDAAMWISADDGTSWKRAPARPGLTDASVFRVTSSPAGYVAVGSDGYPGPSTQDVGSRGAAVWTSSDGQAWVREPSEVALGGAFMTSVISVGQGFIATGTIHGTPGGPTPPPPIWVSPDGRNWHRARSAPSLAHADSFTVSPGPGGYILTGSIFDPTVGTSQAGAWWSSDGSSWARTSSSIGSVSAITLLDGQILAIGDRLEGPSPVFDVRVWVSADGRSWQALPSVASFKNASVNDADVNNGRLVIVGGNADPNAATELGYVWSATKP
jgi:hypothetical protein